jgi:hypothetical protein
LDRPFYPGAQVIVRDLQTLQTLQVQGASSDMYGYSPVNMYVAARALWSPGISWKAAVQDFCGRYYADVGEEMTENEFRLEVGIFGLNGYQASGARDPEKWSPPPAAGLYLQQQRPEQITFLKRLIDKTKDPQVRVRLERALKPWELWNKEPRFASQFQGFQLARKEGRRLACPVRGGLQPREPEFGLSHVLHGCPWRLRSISQLAPECGKVRVSSGSPGLRLYARPASLTA